MPIKVLDDRVIAQIAAGEVIERPASVVKELTENALDAGATTVHIAVSGGGRRLMRVSDNGQGIHSDEVETAFARHATSKLTTADDLSHIQTLGFRGEALASIASISQVTLTTRAYNEDVGTRLRLEGGHIIHRQPLGAPAGTVVTVENLFYNTPARLKFLKAENTEKRQVAVVTARYAIAYPQVRFTLEQDGREAFRSSGSGQLADALVTVLGVDTFRDMIEIDSDTADHERRSDIRVYGYTSLPSLNRADRSRIMLYVNGRWIQDSSLSYAVTQAYHTLLMKGRYPVSVVMIELSSEEVDVNVHPAKSEVRFRNPNEVFAVVQRTIRRALLDQAQTPTFGRHRLSEFPLHEESSGRAQMSIGFEMDSPGSYSHQRLTVDDNDAHEIPVGPDSPKKPRTLPMLRVIGQVGASYIVAEGPAGLYLIDQHAAHERVLYEQFLDNYHKQGTITQFTLASQTIELPAPEAQLIEANLATLKAVGFQLENFGPNTFIIRSIPAMLADRDPVEAVSAVLEELENDQTPGQSSIEEKIIRRVCKQAAVKAGTILSVEEMRGLIQQLERTRSPLTCPHGRPTMLHMSGDQLAREFGRQ